MPPASIANANGGFFEGLMSGARGTAGPPPAGLKNFLIIFTKPKSKKWRFCKIALFFKVEMNFQKHFNKENGFLVAGQCQCNVKLHWSMQPEAQWYSSLLNIWRSRGAPLLTSFFIAPVAHHFLFFLPWRICVLSIFPFRVGFGKPVAHHFPLNHNGIF